MRTPIGIAVACAVVAAVAVSAEEVVYLANGYGHSMTQPEWSSVMMLRGSDLKILQTLVLPAFDAHSIAITPDRSQLWVTCPNGYHLFVIDAESFQYIESLDFSDTLSEPMGIAVTPDGEQVFVAMHQDDLLVRFDADSCAPLAPDLHADVEGSFIVFTPEGTRFCLVDQGSRKVRIFRTADRRPLYTYTLGEHGGLGDAAASPDGQYLYVSTMDHHRIDRLTLQDPWMITPLPTDGFTRPRGIDISPDGNYLFIGHYIPDAAKVTMWQLAPFWANVAQADIPSNGRRVVRNRDCTRIYVTEHAEHECRAYRVNTGEESMFLDAVADLNTIEGYRATPVGVAVGDWEPHRRNYLNLRVTPGYLEAGEEGVLGYECGFDVLDFRDTPVDIYLAAVRDPVAVNRPSTVEEALAGGEVWFYGSGMAYAYTGALREPTWSGVRFPPTAVSGTLPFTAGGGWNDRWVFAAAFVRAGVGPVRTDGIPVENSNIFRLP